jgi:hypothetical protein
MTPDLFRRAVPNVQEEMLRSIQYTVKLAGAS